MRKFNKILGAAAIAGAAAITMQSAHAWGPWGGGPGGWNNGNDWFGDGFGDFNMNMSGRGNGWGRGYNSYAPYYGAPYGYGGYPYGGYGGYPGYAPYGAPVAPRAPQQAQPKQ
ncbi:MAG: sulfur globule family protein [Gammaproteobacteria bacterium]|nr:sulfur globule family protein [Gammaproteobacteria bacterium]